MIQPPENQQQYGSILTVLGENAEQNGKLQNKQISFTHIAIGDANDTYVQPDRMQSDLVNELARIPVNSVDVLQPTPNSVPMLKVEAILPDHINDLVIREFAAVAEFNGQTYFHAVGNNARIYVPPPVNNGNVRTPVTLEMIFVITSAEPIVEIDPHVVTASREYVRTEDDKITGMTTGSRQFLTGNLVNYNSGAMQINGHDSLRLNDYPKVGDSTLFIINNPPSMGFISKLDPVKNTVSFQDGFECQIAAHGGKQAPYFIGWRNFQNIRAEDYDTHQKAFDDCQRGGSIELAAETLTESIVIDKPMHISGYGQSNPIYGRENDLALKMGAPDIPMFLLRPQEGGSSGDYFDGQFAIIGVTFSDFKAVGYKGRTNNFVDVEQVNNGNYHVRGVEHRGIVTDNFDITFNYRGRCYLIDFYGGSVLASNVGFRNTYQNEAGGQCRIFGTDFIGNDLAMDIQSGSFDLSLFGASISENRGGIRMRHTNPFRSSGCVYEGNKSTDPSHLNTSIYIENRGDNPQTHAFKSIGGNKFLASDFDIFIEDNEAGWESISMPGLIEANEFQGKVRFDSAIETNMKFGCNGILNAENIIGLSPKIDARVSDWTSLNSVSQSMPVSTNSIGTGNNVFFFTHLDNNKTIKFTNGYRASYTDFGFTSDNVGLEMQYHDGSGWVSIRNLYGKGKFGLVEFKNTTGETIPIRVYANDAGTGNKYMVSMLTNIS